MQTCRLRSWASTEQMTVQVVVMGNAIHVCKSRVYCNMEFVQKVLTTSPCTLPLR
jgi:hypothetical protein